MEKHYIEAKMENDKILFNWVKSKIGKKDIKEYQLEKLNSTLSQVKNSVFYRNRFDKYELNTLEEIAQLPFTTSEDLVNYGSKMLCVSQSEIEKVTTLNTSGSTGEKKRIFFTKEDLELTIDFFSEGLKQLGGNRTLILMPGVKENEMGNLIYKSLIRGGNDPILYGLPEDFNDLKDPVLQADSIIAPPILLYALGKYIKHIGVEKKFKGVLVSSDYLPRIVKANLEKLFSCKVFEHFGMTETGLGGAVECVYHNYMHIRDGDLYFEIIDPITGKVLPEGNLGEIVITTLTRVGMPLIRYRTGDRGRVFFSKCKCGICGNLLGDVSRYSNNIELDEAMFSIDGVVDYRVDYASHNNINITVICFPSETPEKGLILSSVESLFDGDITLNIKKVDDFEILHRGKRKVIKQI